MTTLADKIEALAETLAGALEKIAPITVHNGPDYAEVYFADGKTHSTQAMTMNPQDWLDLSEALRQYKEAREIERLRDALGEICADSNPDWTEKRVYPDCVLNDIHTIAVNAYYKVNL